MSLVKRARSVEVKCHRKNEWTLRVIIRFGSFSKILNTLRVIDTLGSFRKILNTLRVVYTFNSFNIILNKYAKSSKKVWFIQKTHIC